MVLRFLNPIASPLPDIVEQSRCQNTLASTPRDQNGALEADRRRWDRASPGVPRAPHLRLRAFTQLRDRSISWCGT